MSRYQIPAKLARHQVVVGFDPPVQTYFFQVFDHLAPDDNDMIAWEGADPRKPKITRISVLQSMIEPYAVIPPNIEELLASDWAHKSEPTPLQKLMMDLFQP